MENDISKIHLFRFFWIRILCGSGIGYKVCDIRAYVSGKKFIRFVLGLRLYVLGKSYVQSYIGIALGRFFFHGNLLNMPIFNVQEVLELK